MIWTPLQLQDCRPCRKDLPGMTLIQAQRYKTKTPTWSIEKSAKAMRLVKTFAFPDRKHSRQFVRLVERQSDLQNHHARIVLNDNAIQIEWWTHVIQGLHKNDFIMAAKTDKIFENFI
jgi:4a-hydroxytetrahydrobiopterin dehydratase